MENISWFEIVSLLTTLASLTLAIVAIWFARAAEKESRSNYEKTKDVLAEIDKRAEVIQTTVSDSQRQLMGTMTNILNETVIPKKQDMGEMMAASFLQAILPAIAEDPEKLGELVASINSLKGD